ncbi:hypothetical protein M885DRAFT_514333 [Pelagophyceae sp. CCMP2097]|nr:hypothetical protein M885DRAFT_514333 [Pelagophyceae sp. CCMP2097]
MVLPAHKRIEMVGAPPQHLKKKTLIKSRVGLVRTTAYDLPEEAHIYGKADAKDQEDAGLVMSRWIASNPSKARASQRSFVKTNMKALEAGCLDAKSQRAYAEEHTDICFKQPSGKTQTRSNTNSFKGPYGQSNARHDESIRPLIEAHYTDWQPEQLDYPDLTVNDQKHKLRAPRSTRASEGHDSRNKVLPEEKAPFKMKKFANVESRIKMPH